MGKEYNEEENVSEVDFMLEFPQLFKKDMKYFMGQNFEFNPQLISLLETYKEFLTLNKGFVETKTNTDVVLPKAVKTEQAEEYKTMIDKVLETKDLSKLLEYLPTIL